MTHRRGQKKKEHDGRTSARHWTPKLNQFFVSLSKKDLTT
jgi:hypothetical protein